MPPKKDIWQRYLRKFTKQGKLLEFDLGLMEEAPRATERGVSCHRGWWGGVRRGFPGAEYP